MRVVRAILITVSMCLLSGAVFAATITVSAAVSLREAVTDAAAVYEKQGGDHVDFTFGASGQLAAQINNGAPVDAFISAANKQVDDLTAKGLVEPDSRLVVAGNDLVLIVPADASDTPRAFSELGRASVKKLAIGEPKTVPAGQYAMQVLQATKQEQSLHDRLIFGANVRQVLDYVERGEVSAGIVYATDAKQAGDKVKVVATADASTHEPIIYPAVVLKNSGKKEAAKKFMEYLAGATGRSFFVARGFSAPPPDPTSSPSRPAQTK